MSWKRLILMLLSLAIMVGIAASIIYYLVDWDGFQRRLTSVVKAQTGYDLVVEGGVEVDIFPNLAVSMNQVAVQRPLSDQESVLSIGNVIISYSYIGLFTGQGVANVKVIEPYLVVEKFVDRSSNWHIEALPALFSSLFSQQSEERKKAYNIDIKNAQISFYTGRSFQPYAYDVFLDRATIVADSATGPFEVTASSRGDIDQQPIDFSFKAGDLHQSSKLKFQLAYGDNRLLLKGNTRYENDQVVFEGDLESAIYGDFEKDNFSEPVMLRSKVGLKDGVISLSSASLKSDYFDVGADLKMSLFDVKGQSRRDYLRLVSNKIDLTQFYKKEAVGLVAVDPISWPVIAQLVYPAVKGRYFEFDVALNNIVFEANNAGSINVRSTDEGKRVYYDIDVDGLPGMSRIVADGYLEKDTQRFYSEAQINSTFGMELLRFLQLPHESINAEALQNIQLNTSLVWDQNTIQLSKVQLQMLDQTILGRVLLDYNNGLVINSAVKANKINIYDFVHKSEMEDPLAIYNNNPQQEFFDDIRNIDLYIESASMGFDIEQLLLGKNRIITDVTGTSRVYPGILRFDDLSFKYNDNLFQGNGLINTRKLDPVIKVNVVADKVDLANVAAIQNAKEEEIGFGLWSDYEIDLAHWAIYSGDVTFKANQFLVGELRASDVDIELGLKRGSVEIERFNSQLYGSRVEVTGNVALNPIFAYLTISTPNMNMGPFLKDMFGIEAIDARAGMSARVSASGNRPVDWVETMQGAVNMVARNVVVRGFDFPLLSQKIPALEDIRQVRYWGHKALHSGLTQFDYYTAALKIDHGVISVEKSSLPHAVLGNNNVSFDLDLVNWTLDLEGKFDVNAGGSAIPVALTVNGDINHLTSYWERKNIEAFWAERFYR